METDKYIELTKEQQQLFQTPTQQMELADINCDAALVPLAMDGKDILRRMRALSVMDYGLYFKCRKFDKQVNLFVPVAHAVLLAELEDLLIDPQKLNRED